MVAFPDEIQYSSVYAFLALKTKAGNKIWAGGNQYRVKPQFGRQDASLGWEINLEKTKGNLKFAIPRPLYINGQIRDLRMFNNKVVVGVNDGLLKICEINQ